MKVKNWMVRDLITVRPSTKLPEAIEIMHRHSIRHLPVMEGERMVGFVTESNLRQYLLPAAVKEITMEDVMIVDPITVDAEASIDSAAKIIYQHKIGGLPVMEEGALAGIITITDILAAFIELMGLLQESSRLDIVLGQGEIDDVLRIIRDFGGRIISVGVDTKDPARKVYYIRLEKMDLQPIIDAIEGQGHRVLSVIN